MRHETNRRSVRVHALRLNSSAVAQGGIAAVITLAVAWLISAW